MIRISLDPGTLVAGQTAVLTVGLSNTGQDACSDVAFRLKLPPGMALVSGRDRIDVDQIQPRKSHVHQVTVLPGRPGDVEVGTSNFSYRDEDGITRRDDNWRVPVRVLPAGQAPALGQLRRLTVRDSGRKLALGEWDVLEVFLHNTTGIPLHDVTLTLGGPIRFAGSSARIALLRDGGTGRAAVSVNVPDRGKVPISVRLTYRYRDERGQVLSGRQDDQLTVETARAAETVPPSVTTVLYVVAQPRDWDALASYQELREIEGLWRLSRNRERYQLERCVAARLTDVSGALGEYRPQLVHFSGHGIEDGSLAFEADDTLASLVDPAGLVSLLAGFADSVRCVIVNACYSLALAEAIVKEIDYVVGMRSAILDDASVQFSKGFYQGLFAGKAVPEAFLQGKALVQGEPGTTSEYEVPILLERRPPNPA